MSRTVWSSDSGWVDENTLRALAAILWPDDDPDAEWSPDTLDSIADTLTRAGWHPDDRPARELAAECAR